MAAPPQNLPWEGPPALSELSPSAIVFSASPSMMFLGFGGGMGSATIRQESLPPATELPALDDLLSRPGAPASTEPNHPSASTTMVQTPAVAGAPAATNRSSSN